MPDRQRRGLACLRGEPTPPIFAVNLGVGLGASQGSSVKCCKSGGDSEVIAIALPAQALPLVLADVWSRDPGRRTW